MFGSQGDLLKNVYHRCPSPLYEADIEGHSPAQTSLWSSDSPFHCSSFPNAAIVSLLLTHDQSILVLFFPGETP